MEEYIVYVKVDDGVIVDINSNAFISGEGWTEIDRGEGDKYHHAQGHYLEHGLADADGLYNYKLVRAFRCSALMRRKLLSVRG